MALDKPRGKIRVGLFVDAQPSDGDDVQGPVDRSVATLVEAMTGSFARRSRNRADTAQGGGARFGFDPFGIVSRSEHQLGGAVAADRIARDTRRLPLETAGASAARSAGSCRSEERCRGRLRRQRRAGQYGRATRAFAARCSQRPRPPDKRGRPMTR